MNTRLMLASLGATLCAMLVPAVALAQADRPTMRLVVGLAPGGSHDITSRALAEELRRWEAPVKASGFKEN